MKPKEGSRIKLKKGEGLVLRQKGSRIRICSKKGEG